MAIFTLLVSCAKKNEPARAEYVLGTLCTVNLFEDGTDTLYDALFSRLRQLDDNFSTTNPKSFVSAVNAAAGKHPVFVGKDVFTVLKKALEIAELTDGAFDPTIGPLVTLWGINTEHTHVPSQAELSKVLALIDYKKIILNEHNTTAFLSSENMALDLGGIAKGYAADELVKILRSHAVKRAIIDLGGNVYVFGKKIDGKPWNVGIKNPEAPSGEPLLALRIPEKSVVTSGVYERFFEQNGIRYHHILSGKTGFPVQNGLRSVTVISASSMTADALSTGCFVLGKEKGLALAEWLGVDAIFIDDSITMTQELMKSF